MLARHLAIITESLAVIERNVDVPFPGGCRHLNDRSVGGNAIIRAFDDCVDGLTELKRSEGKFKSLSKISKSSLDEADAKVRTLKGRLIDEKDVFLDQIREIESQIEQLKNEPGDVLQKEISESMFKTIKWNLLIFATIMGCVMLSIIGLAYLQGKSTGAAGAADGKYIDASIT